VPVHELLDYHIFVCCIGCALGAEEIAKVRFSTQTQAKLFLSYRKCLSKTAHSNENSS